LVKASGGNQKVFALRIWLLVLLLLTVPAQAQDLPSVHLKVVGGLGPTVQYTKFEEPFWAKELAEASNGRVTAEVTPSDQSGIKGPELLQFTRLGAIAISTVSLSQIASEDPEAAAVDLADPDELARYCGMHGGHRSRHGLSHFVIKKSKERNIDAHSSVVAVRPPGPGGLGGFGSADTRSPASPRTEARREAQGAAEQGPSAPGGDRGSLSLQDRAFREAKAGDEAVV
jgi:hypothetical protein